MANTRKFQPVSHSVGRFKIKWVQKSAPRHDGSKHKSLGFVCYFHRGNRWLLLPKGEYDTELPLHILPAQLFETSAKIIAILEEAALPETPQLEDTDRYAETLLKLARLPDIELWAVSNFSLKNHTEAPRG